MDSVKPNEQRSKFVILMIWIVLLLGGISLFFDILQYQLLQEIKMGKDFSLDAASANDLRQRIIGILYFLAYVISAIAFILWFRRAYFNLHVKVKTLTFAEGWAAGCWFVPVINLFRPYQIMKELYQETDKLLEGRNENYLQKITPRFLGIWWVLWIVIGVVGQVVFRLTLNADTVDDLNTSTIASIIGDIIDIPLALITIKIIHDYSLVEGMIDDLKENEIQSELPDSSQMPYSEEVN